MTHHIIDGHRYISEDYQRVIIVASHGKLEDGGGRPIDREYVFDTSGIIYKAADWVPFHDE